MTLKCQRCGAKVPTPDLSDDLKQEISDIALRTGRMQAVLALRNSGQIDLVGAKAIVFHLAGENETCHRCGISLIEDGLEESCHKCHSLNLKWLSPTVQ